MQQPVRPSPWWRNAVIYQVYPRSFADGNGDGVGDLRGISERLPALAELGVDGVWISPFFRSPQHDHGYDVADYRDVDPMFGTLADFDELIAHAHSLGLRLVIDIVPNHTSSEHTWFQQALAAGPGSVERARYFFRDGRGEDGALPPNNWQSAFGGDAWTRITEADGEPGQWYLHLFAPEQPDLDWRNREVRDEFLGVFRFWADRGVDGFRIDVAHGMIKQEGLPDYVRPEDGDGLADAGDAPPMWAQPEVHEIVREWRAMLDGYGRDVLLCAEAWVSPLSTLALWTRDGEMQHAFNFVYLNTGWEERTLRDVIQESIEAFSDGGVPTWVLSNHDLVRHATRLAIEGPFVMSTGIGPRSPNRQHDAVLGLARARAATLTMLALPGAAYLYQGEELGLPEVIDLPDEARTDPTYFGSGGAVYGRDGSRVPIPWTANAMHAGFGGGADPWLPLPRDWSRYARDLQRGVVGSTLELYRTALRERRRLGLGLASLSWCEAAPDVLAFEVGSVRVWMNMGAADVTLPDEEVLVCSRLQLDDAVLPPDTTVWLRARR